MSALEEYRTRIQDISELSFDDACDIHELIDAAIGELEAENLLVAVDNAELQAMLRLKWEDLRMLHVAGESYFGWFDDIRKRVRKGWKA